MGGDAAARGRKKVKKAIKFLESARAISWREQVSFLTEKGVPKEAQREAFVHVQGRVPWETPALQAAKYLREAGDLSKEAKVGLLRAHPSSRTAQSPTHAEIRRARDLGRKLPYRSRPCPP